MLGLRQWVAAHGVFLPHPPTQGPRELWFNQLCSPLQEARWVLGTSPSEQREACAGPGVGLIVLRLTEGRSEAGAAKGVLLIQSGPCLQQYLVRGSAQPPQFVRKIRIKMTARRPLAWG